jgi:dipeptidyl aminopeptidase/acylaminoacyl peptidase
VNLKEKTALADRTGGAAMTWGCRFCLALAALALLTGCAPADPVRQAVGTSPRTAPGVDSGAPVLAGVSADVPSPAAAVSVPPAATVSAADPVLPPVPDVPTDGITESEVWVPAGDHRVPGTFTLPAQPSPTPLPVVLLLHGDFSSRNENGDLFARQAAALAAGGIASLRIDFAGSGDSEQTDLQLDYPGMVADATASVDFLRSDPLLDPTRVAVLGLSRGGSIAATLAGTVPGVAALVEWSGAVYNGYDEAPDLHDQARAAGDVTLGSDPGSFRLSLSWFDSIERSHPLDDVTGYTGPVLAVTGGADEVVPPEVSDVLIQTVASTDTTRYVVENADHEFDATSDDQAHTEEALGVTTDWLVAKLGGTSTP